MRHWSVSDLFDTDLQLLFVLENYYFEKWCHSKASMFLTIPSFLRKAEVFQSSKRALLLFVNRTCQLWCYILLATGKVVDE